MLPDDDTSSDEEVKVEDTDDISERESQVYLRNSDRRLVARNTDMLGPRGLTNVGVVQADE